MSESFEKAVEAAAILSCATFDQDRIWHNLLDEEEREDYRKDAAAMLRAALPHLTAEDVTITWTNQDRRRFAQIIRRAKARAWDEGYRSSETSWEHVYSGRPVPEGEMCPECCQSKPYAEEADHE